MRKSQLYSALGKSRPSSTSRCNTPFSCRFSTGPPYRAASDQDSNSNQLNPPRNRSQRLRAASEEIQSLYERSASQNPPKSPQSSTSNSQPFKISYEARDYPNQSDSRATAPAALKERLRQRALERSSQQSQPSRSSAPPITPLASGREARFQEPSTSRPTSRSPQDRKKRGAGGRGRDFDGASSGRGRRRGEEEDDDGGREIVLSPEQQELADRQKKAEQDYTDELFHAAIKGRESFPPVFRESEEGREFLNMVHPYQVEPRDLLVEELQGHQIGGRGRIAGLLDLARQMARGESVHFGSREEGEDVGALVEWLRHRNAEKEVKEKMGRPKGGREEAEEGARRVVGKWVGGFYEGIGNGVVEVGKGNVLDGVRLALRANKSYMPEDEKGVLAQVEKLVGQGRVQPTGKVREAVRAAAS